MNPTARVVGAVIAGILVVGGIVLLARPESNIGTQTPPPTQGSPSPSLASPTGSPALDATFTSARYGYSISYPRSWSAHPAMTKPGTIDDPIVDVTEPSPYDELDCGPYPRGCGDNAVRFATFFGIAARPPAGVTPRQWVAANNEPACPSILGVDTVMIDGLTAVVTEGGCDGGLGPHYHYTVLLATGDLVYRFQLTSSEHPDERFLPMLATIHLVSTPPAN